MITNTGPGALRAAAAVAALLALAGCAGGSNNAPVEYRGTAPGQQSLGDSGISGDGIVDYDGYQAAIARDGDTVASVAARVGVSPSELGAYNGLAPTHPLRAGDELVLPPAGGAAGPSNPDTAVATGPLPQTRPIEATPLDGDLAAADPALVEDAPVEAATDAEVSATPLPGQSGWSPDLAAAAIDRATGIDDEGNLAAPPSANDPLPENPTDARPLESPDLGQYQTPPPPDAEVDAGESVEEAAADGAADAPVEPTARPEIVPDAEPAPETEVAALDPPEADAPAADATAPDFQPAPETVSPAAGNTTAPEPAAPAPTDTRVAATAPAATAAPAAGSGRLQRPVAGPVALGFGQGAGGVRNEGVDFAAQPGAPVVAAADGEVALVSQALGGLGTILLLRHEGELLTVYGRISDVAVSKGDIVRRGQQIGTVARPDAPTEPRMHFEVRQGADPVDPLTYIGG